MRAAGTTAAGGYLNGPGPALRTGVVEDPDVVRERREAARAALAAKNPFAAPSGQPRTKSTARLHGAALVSTEYEKAAFMTPPPAPIAHTEEVPVPAPKPTPRRPLKPTVPPTTTSPVVDAAGIVREYVEDGLDAGAIARARDLTVSEVHRILEEAPGVTLRTDAPAQPAEEAELHDLAPAPRSAEAREIRKRQIITLYVGGEQLTMPQIAERLGCAVSTVHRTLKLAGVPTRPQGRQPAPEAPALDDVATTPVESTEKAPRPSVRPASSGHGFVWTCPGHKPVIGELTRTYQAAWLELEDHLRKEHRQEQEAAA